MVYKVNNNIHPQVNTHYYQIQSYNPNDMGPVSNATVQPAPQWTPEMAATMKNQLLPIISRGSGYTEFAPFKVPVLNTQGRLYKLDNGQGVIIVPKKGPTTIKTYVKTGSFNEPEYRGIRHFIEHSLFNGSRNLKPNEFVEKVVGMGGLYNASTDTADTDYYIKFPQHKDTDFEEFMKMHADMIMFPKFTEPMIEKEKGPVISEIQMYQDDPFDKAYNTLIKNLFGIKTDYQGLIAGSSKTIQGLTKEIVQERFESNYSPDKMLTVIVGDVDPDKAINLTSRLFNQKKATPEQLNKQEYHEPLRLTDKPVRTDMTSNHIDANLLVIGMAGPKNNNIKDSIATMGLITALTGYENAMMIRALKPYNAQPSMDMSILSSNYNAPQIIQLGANFKPGQEEQGLRAIYSVLADAANRPLRQQELFIVKNKMKDNLSVLSESSMNIADLAANAVIGHGDIRGYTDIEKHIDNLTAQDIQNAARKYLDLNRASIVMVHPERQQSVARIGFGSNSDKFKFNYLKEYSLPNNIHVVINDDPGSIRTSADIKFKTDGFKTLKPGVADVLSLMMTKGTKNYSEEHLNQVIDTYNLGISTNVTENSLSISSNTRKEMLPFSLQVMKEILYNPDLSPEKFDKAKEEIKLLYSSVPKEPLSRALEVLYPDHKMGLSTRRTLEEIDRVTLYDVVALHQQLVSDSQGTAVIDAPVSKTPGLGNALFAQLQTGIAAAKPYHLTPTPVSQPLSQNIVIAEAEDRDQADIVQVFKIKPSGNIKDNAAILLMNEIIGGNSNSWLFTDLREKQKLAYRVKTTYNEDGKYGNLIFQIKTTTEDDIKGSKPENLKKSLDGFRHYINKIITEPVSDKELETAKLEVKTKLSNLMEYSSARSGLISSTADSYYGVQQTNALVDAIDGITKSDIQNAANAYLRQPSAISFIASPNTINNMKPYLESLAQTVYY